jgi:hypothetical protein
MLIKRMQALDWPQELTSSFMMRKKSVTPGVLNLPLGPGLGSCCSAVWTTQHTVAQYVDTAQPSYA